MKNTWKRIFALCLCLVMVAVLLPVTNAQAAVSDLTTDEIVLLDEDFTQYTSITDLTSLSNYVKHSSNVVYEDNLVKAGGKTSDSCITFSFDVDIPASNDSMVFYIKYEAVISAPQDTTDGSKTKKYMCDINAFYDREGNTISSKPTTVSGSSSTIAFTDGYEKVTLVYQIKTTNDIGKFEARLGGRKDTDSSAEFNETGYVSIKSFKVSILAAECAPESADMITAMAYEDAYVKLTDDVTLVANADLGQDGSLTLGKNAVLDLNGYTLTGSSINVPVGAQIVDTSAEKTGKLAVNEDGLIFANPDHPTLPLYTGDGYILTEPQLGDSRAFFVDGSVSANGFVLDFRPGFGAVGGKNVREEYLANGSCGITMDAQLSWTDIFGVNGSAKLACDSVFTGMYENANRRGRLALTGAEKYQTISLSISLSSCGVVKTFDLPTFSNEDRMTIHVAVQSDVYEKTSSGNGSTYPFNAPIDTTTANKLVLEFGLQVTDANSESPLDERFGFRMTPAQAYCDTGSYTSGYYFGLYGAGFNPGQRLVSTCDSTLCRVGAIDTAETVKYKLEVDISTGAWVVYENGVQVESGTYPEEGHSTTAAEILNGVSSMFIRFQDAGNYNFSNMLLYSVKSGS